MHYLRKEFSEILKDIGAIETAVVIHIQLRHEVREVTKLYTETIIFSAQYNR